MNLYLWVDLLILVFPLALSFDRKVRYVRRWPAAAASALLVGLPYAAWDSFMAARGAWAFSDRFAGAGRLLFLPLGEYLFFLVVPFACLFVSEVVRAYLPEKTVRPLRLPWIVIAAACGLAAVLCGARLYTATVLLATGIFLLLAAALAPGMLASRRFWLSMLACYLPFLLANGLLTGLPVVTYDAGTILGPRAFSIPVEDFLYSFSMIGMNFLAFRFLVQRLPGPRRTGNPPAAPRDRSHDERQEQGARENKHEE